MEKSNGIRYSFLLYCTLGRGPKFIKGRLGNAGRDSICSAGNNTIFQIVMKNSWAVHTDNFLSIPWFIVNSRFTSYN